MNIIEKIKKMEEELNTMKKVHAKEIKEHEEKEKARAFFRKHFNLYISDDYNIYPKEYTSNCETKFVNNMWGYDDKEKLRELNELKKEYLTLIKNDIEMLQKEYKRIKKELGLEDEE